MLPDVPPPIPPPPTAAPTTEAHAPRVHPHAVHPHAAYSPGLIHLTDALERIAAAEEAAGRAAEDRGPWGFPGGLSADVGKV
jgi:hypothetical protein